MARYATVEDYVASLAEPLREIAGKVAEIAGESLPDAAPAVWQGHPVWSLGAAPGKQPVCYVKAYTSYVTFGLWRGQEVDDPSGRLEPGARNMAQVKLRETADIDAALFAGWLRAARALEEPAQA